MAKPRGETASFNVLTPRDTSLVIYDDIHQFLPEVCQPTQPAGEMAQKQMKLWELAAAEDQRVFSPYVWAIKLVMDAKALDYERVPWHYHQKDLIKPSQTVPVLDVDVKRLHESWDIAQYLEKQYSGTNVFKAGGTDIQETTEWANTKLYMAIAKVVLVDLLNALAPEDKQYFRQSREEKFGQTLEEVVGDQAEKIAALRTELDPIRSKLQSQKWLGGEEANYADFAVAGMFLWPWAISPAKLLEKNDPVYAWRDRLFKRYAGALDNARGFDKSLT